MSEKPKTASSDRKVGGVFVQEILDRYLGDLRSEGKAEKTIESYRTGVRALLAYLGRAGIELGRLTARDVREYRRHLATHNYAPASVNLKMNIVRSFSHWLVAEGILTEDPTRGLVVGRLPDRDAVYVTAEEAGRMLHAARWDLPGRVAIRMLESTGMRRAEALTRTWADVDLERGELRVEGKGGRNRTVPLTTPLIEELRELRAREQPGPEDRILVNRFGRPLGKDGLRRIVQQYAQAAGIQKKITPHSFRHGLATRLAQAGTDAFLVARILGHADLTTTQRYVHPSAQSKREAMQAIALRQTAATAPMAAKPAPEAVLGLLQLLARGAWKDMPNTREGVVSGFWQDLHSLLLAVAEYQHEAERRTPEESDRA